MTSDVSFALRVDPTSANNFASVLTLRVALTPKTRQNFDRLRATPAGFNAPYRDSLIATLQTNAVVDRFTAENLVNGMRQLPKLRINGDIAELSITSSTPGMWEVQPNAHKLMLWSRNVPRNGHLRVLLSVRKGHLDSVSPLPTRETSDDDVEWDFSAGRTPDLLAQVNPRVYGGGPGHLAQELSFAGAATLPFVLLLAGLGVRVPARGVRRLAGAAIAAAIAWVCYAIAVRINARNSTGEIVLQSVRCGVPLAALLVIALLARDQSAAAGAGRGVNTAVSPARDVPTADTRAAWTDRHPRKYAVIVWLLVLLLVAGFAAASVYGSHLAGFGFEPPRHSDLPTYAFVATTLAVAPLALAVWIAARWLSVASGPLGSKVSPVLGRWRWWIAAAVVSAFLAQLILASHAESRQFYASGFGGGDQPPAWASALASLTGDLPFILSNVLINILAVAVMGLLSWRLYEDRGESEPEYSSRWCFGIALLFALAVGGTGGTLHGYAAPIAFVLTVPLVTLGLHTAATRRRAGVLRGARGRSTELLADALEVAAMDRSLSAPTAGSTTPESDATKIQAEAAEPEADGAASDASRARSAPAKRRNDFLARVQLAGSRPDDREADLLEAALYGGAGLRARLKILAESGWWVVAMPAAYGIYSLIHKNGPGAVSASQPLGLAFLATGILTQVVMWPVAAGCFVAVIPVIPGRHAVIKAGTAITAYVLPAALAAWILGGGHEGTNWPFVAAELALVYVALGLILDYRTIRKAGFELRDLGVLYHLTTVRAAVVYAAPLTVLLFTVVHGLATGKGASALGDLITNAPALLPAGGR